MSVETVDTFPTEQTFDDKALFDDAEATEAPDTPVAATTETDKEPEPVVAATTEAPAEKPVADDNAAMVPSFRLKQEAEARRLLETDLANERAERAALRQRLEAMERPKPAEQPKAVKPDPLLDPEGYEAYLEQKFEEKQIAVHRENSLKAAARLYKDEFTEAYKAAQQKVDPALRALMQQSDDPGEALIQWHRGEKTKAEIGTDLNAYKQRLREEALKDPEFRKAAMEAWRADAQPLNNGRPNVELPPTLSGASRSSLTSTIDTDISDEGLWNHVNA